MKIKDIIVEQGLLRRFGDYLDRKGGGKGDWGRPQTANPRSVARDEYLTSLQKLNLEGFIDHFRQQGTYTEKEYRNLGKVAWDRYKVYRDGQGLDPKTASSNAIADAKSGKSITTPAQPAQAPAQTQKSSQTTAKFQPRTPNVWRSPRRAAKSIGTVVVPIRAGRRAGEIVEKTSDGWFDEQGQKITDPAEIQELDALLGPQYYDSTMRTVK